MELISKFLEQATEFLKEWSSIIGIFISLGTLIASFKTRKTVSAALEEYRKKKEGAMRLNELSGKLKSLRDNHPCDQAMLMDILSRTKEIQVLDTNMKQKHSGELKRLEDATLDCLKMCREQKAFDAIEMIYALMNVVTLYEKEIYNDD